MLLTSRMLLENGACTHWHSVFDYRFPNGLRLYTKYDLADAIRFGGMGPVLEWFICTFDDLKQIEHLKNSSGKIDLTDCSFEKADLMGLKCRDTDFSGSSFKLSNLHFSCFNRCVFKESPMRFSLLKNCQIRSCDFTKADLTGAYLHGANLEFTSVKDTKLDAIQVDDKTIWASSEPMPMELNGARTIILS